MKFNARRLAVFAFGSAVAFAQPAMSQDTSCATETKTETRLLACTDAYVRHVQETHRSIASQLHAPLEQMENAMVVYKKDRGLADFQRSVRAAAHNILAMGEQPNGYLLNVGIVTEFAGTLIAMTSAPLQTQQMATGMPQPD
jgi:hypothetical protein